MNLMITMLLGGLWHGASWTFVAWGALHGLYLCVEKLIQDYRTKKTLLLEPVNSEPKEQLVMQGVTAPRFLNKIWPRNFLLALFTFFLVNVTWVFFRAADFSTAWRILNSMFGNVTGGAVLLSTLAIIKVSVITVLLVTCHWLMRNTRVLNVADKQRWWLLGVVWAALLILLMICQESSSSFIYFQF